MILSKRHLFVLLLNVAVLAFIVYGKLTRKRVKAVSESKQCDFVFVFRDEYVWQKPDGQLQIGRSGGMTGCGEPPSDRWYCRAHGMTIEPLATTSEKYKQMFAATPPAPQQCASEVERLRRAREEWAEGQRRAARAAKWRQFYTLPHRLWLTLLGREHDECGEDW